MEDTAPRAYFAGSTRTRSMCGATASELRELRNALVGHRAAKAHFAQEGHVPHLVTVLVAPLAENSAFEMQTLAASILGLVAQHAAPPTLLALLRAEVPLALLSCLGAALARMRDAAALIDAALRALRTILCAAADQVGASARWGLGSGWGRATATGLMHIDARNASESAHRPSSTSLRQDVSWAAAGPPADEIRRNWQNDAVRQLACGMDKGLNAPPLSNPAAELHWLCRRAISALFDNVYLPYVLSALLKSHEVERRAWAYSITEATCTLLACCIDVPGVERGMYEPVPSVHRLIQARAARMASFSLPAPGDRTLPATMALDVPHALLVAATLPSARVQEAALWALHEMCAATSTPLPDANLERLCVSATPAVRLAALCCQARLSSCDTYPSTERLVRGVVELLASEGAVQVQASFALACMVRDRSDLQAVAVRDMGACEQLHKLLGETAASDDELAVRLFEGCLEALAALALHGDAKRRRIAELPSFLTKTVAPALASPAIGVQIAACRLVRVLSRTVSILRTNLFDAGVADRLHALLDGAPESVQIEAVAVLCNVLIKFSPMKTYLLTNGALDQLVALVHHARHEPLRYNALWALKNALWDSDLALKETVVARIGWDTLIKLTGTVDVRIREQALNILRNLTSASDASGGNKDAEWVLQCYGKERLFTVVQDAVGAMPDDPCIEQAAFILVNVSAGNEATRAAVLERPALLEVLCFFLTHTNPSIREAGVRCGFHLVFFATNALHTELRSDTLRLQAMARLRDCGYERRLRELEHDPHLAVSDRVRDTLALLQ